jgi:putative toxin-antitoxin system antitoxin component (TIGR02293 family)
MTLLMLDYSQDEDQRMKHALGLYYLVNDGLKASNLRYFMKSTGLKKKDMADLFEVSPSELQKMAAKGKLDSYRSDRLFRAARIFVEVMKYMKGNKKEALTWMLESNLDFHLESPWNLLKTDLGANEIIKLICKYSGQGGKGNNQA